MVKVVVAFDTAEVYGPQGAAMRALFAGERTEADVGYNSLRVAPTGMDAWLALPLRAALEGRAGARIEVAVEEAASAGEQPPSGA